jgi:predicted oxidoreductase
MNSFGKEDVIVVGGGIAGITVALELLNQGRRVRIIDRDVQENFGGLAKESFGGMFFVDTPQQRNVGIKDTPQIALEDWFSVADFGEDDFWPKAWAERYVYHCTTHVYDWLKDLGVKYFPVVHWVERGLLKRGNSFPRFHMVWGTGYELIKVLVRHLTAHPRAVEHLQIDFGFKVDDLILDENVVVGVKGINEQLNEAFELRAAVTVVATGGIGGSIEKVKKHWDKHWGTPPENILNGAHQYGDGTLHDALAKHNGKITHLDWSWPYAAGVSHPRPKIPNQGLSLVPPKSALWLNFKGERIGPMPLITAYDTKFLVEQICKQEKKYSWQVLNRTIANKELAISGSEFNQAIKDKSFFRFLKSILFGNRDLVKDMLANCEDFVEADTIEELVIKMNDLMGNEDVEIELLKSAIHDYDAQIDRGPKFHNDEQLRRIAHSRKYKGDKVRTCNFQKIHEKKALPLIAIRETIISRKTLGGIQTDLDCKVLSETGNVIEGLYAIGEAAGFGGGGLHGKGALEGTFLGGCVLTGRVAAHAIVGKELIGEN